MINFEYIYKYIKRRAWEYLRMELERLHGKNTKQLYEHWRNDLMELSRLFLQDDLGLTYDLYVKVDEKIAQAKWNIKSDPEFGFEVAFDINTLEKLNVPIM